MGAAEPAPAAAAMANGLAAKAAALPPPSGKHQMSPPVWEHLIGPCNAHLRGRSSTMSVVQPGCLGSKLGRALMPHAERHPSGAAAQPPLASAWAVSAFMRFQINVNGGKEQKAARWQGEPFQPGLPPACCHAYPRCCEVQLNKQCAMLLWWPGFAQGGRELQPHESGGHCRPKGLDGPPDSDCYVHQGYKKGCGEHLAITCAVDLPKPACKAWGPGLSSRVPPQYRKCLLHPLACKRNARLRT